MEKKVIDNKLLSWSAYLAVIIRYRSLMVTLARRDLKIRYSQTWLGMAWTLFQPLLALLIFTLFFQGIVEVDTQDIPYPVYAFGGLIFWYYFSGIVQQASSSMLLNEDLIRKIYFPKFILILSKTLVATVDFSIGFIFFLIICIAFGQVPMITLLFVPLIALLLALTAIALSVWISALSVRRRDVLHALPALLNFAIWMTPVFYPASIVPQPYFDWMHYLNPVATIIEIFRWSAFGTPMIWIHCICFVWVAVLLALGVHVFRKVERNVADYV